MHRGNSRTAVLSFLLGGAVGAGLGLYFSPGSGKETRKKIRILFDDIGEKTGELIEEGEETIEEVKRILK